MAFDKPTRNRLSSFVAEARRLIAEEFTQQFQGLYGISDKGTITPIDQLRHLDDIGLATAALLRERIDYLFKTHPEDRDGIKAAVVRLAREQAFTILNRLAAIRMAEKRGFIIESVGKGYQSKGFKVFEQVAGTGLGDTYHRYRRYLFCLFDELAVDLGVLFDRRSPQGLLFPRETALLDLIALLNAPNLDPLWAEDETIGWLYQYYNDPAERKKMRQESAAPRNSRELAVRNQFFTPRYVVEFLTDNTLGRIWYEITQGKTRLTAQCRYLVRRPTEIFLNPGETAPKSSQQDGLSQEEFLKMPVYIPHRLLKDPRDIGLLDPACGSMHFGLYAFDLFEVIYEEAWDLGLDSLRRDYPEKDAFLRDVPRLIIEHNIHGIDIDPRAVQIAGLSLWLRAQKSWNTQRLPAAQRPRILRSNIVCAEPMPGSPELLKEFTAALHPPLLGQLVEKVFVQMQLAGEAGSLLKIEEEIATLVKDAKKLWQSPQKAEQMDLRLGLEPRQKQGLLPLDVSGISDERFWETAEEQIYTALKAYSEQAESGGYQRRLFAEEAARGFAFIDLCRKRYDVVVMNPPFGTFSKLWNNEAKTVYPNSYNDILGAFVERFLHRLHLGGRLGAITSRACFFLTSFTNWRLKVLLRESAIQVIADLGQGVMDEAMVEAAAYVLERNTPTSGTTVFRAIANQERQAVLESCIDAHGEGRQESRVFFANQAIHNLLPDSPFVYWSSASVLKKFQGHPAFKDAVGDVRQGLATADNPRFVRAIWEVSYLERRFKENHKTWTPYILAGPSQPWFSPVTLVVNWARDAAELWNNLNSQGKVRSNIWMLRDAIRLHFFKAGLSWTRRAVRFIPYVVPEGCVPSASRYMAFPHQGKQVEALGVCSSRVVSAFLRFYAEFWQRPNYLVGTLKMLPWPIISDEARKHFKVLIEREVEQRRLAYNNHEPFHEFLVPAKVFDYSKGTEALAFSLETLLDETGEKIVAEAYGLSPEEAKVIERDLLEAIEFQKQGGTTKDEDTEEEEDSNFVLDSSPTTIEEANLSYLVGVVFGRWDIRFATGERQSPELSGPFEQLPVCPPGMLQSAEGLPAEPKDLPADYPLRLSWRGILVDDENHPEDIVTRVREALEAIWKERADAIENEACELLGVKTLRDYFSKPSGFFADHLKRYSKSRRQAPIYWPISTAKGSYTLWIYYHRLTDQTLHTALADFLDPKIKAVRAEISSLRDFTNHRTRVEELIDLEKELIDFHAEIERIIKLPWKPNLNDGVLITACPLWKLFRLLKWQKDLKACWEKLAKGAYDWAHLAYSIWPKRVEDVCKKDRSIAIAHNLEHLCQIEPPKPKAKRGRKGGSK